MDETVFAFVEGEAIPQGSKSVNRKTGMMYDVRSADLKAWRESIGHVMRVALVQQRFVPDDTRPIRLELGFYLLRPKSHFRGGSRAGEMRADAPEYVTTKPDLDKLVRAVLDGLTGVLYRDDSQVATILAEKLYTDPGDKPGVTISAKRRVSL